MMRYKFFFCGGGGIKMEFETKRLRNTELGASFIMTPPLYFGHRHFRVRNYTCYFFPPIFVCLLIVKHFVPIILPLYSCIYEGYLCLNQC
uniref:Uncharacterized protein n=1 Tax=Octopus bimaculoides TaxID=37653 RepID=A0A0L8IBN3_OCTBM